MRLSSVRVGDIVRVNDGMPYFAEVIGHEASQLRVSPITGPRGVRSVKARQVVDHWRKTTIRVRKPGGDA